MNARRCASIPQQPPQASQAGKVRSIHGQVCLTMSWQIVESCVLTVVSDHRYRALNSSRSPN